MFRYTMTLMAIACAASFTVVLANYGFSEPKALFGFAMPCVYFGYYAIREFAFEKKKRFPEFLEEEQRLSDILSSGDEFSSLGQQLESSYRKVGDSPGITRDGRCRCIDFVGELGALRVQVRDGRVAKHELTPKYANDWRGILATLKRELPSLIGPSRDAPK